MSKEFQNTPAVQSASGSIPATESAAKTERDTGAAMQLGFDLSPLNPFSLSYFVRHSGVAQAAAAIESALEQLTKKSDAFFLIVLYGPPGSGKQHLIKGYQQHGAELGVPAGQLKSFIFPAPAERNAMAEPAEVAVEKFISVYERLRSSGGLLLCSLPEHPQQLAPDPHLRSRLLAGELIRTEPPKEDEVGPVVRSLAEKHNLNLTEKSISLIIQHLPRDPLSFEVILAKISELCFAHGKSAGLSVVRAAVSRKAVRSID